MSKQKIKQLIEDKVQGDGMFETGIKGVKLFRETRSIHCTPVIYEPAVIAILGGAKEAILDGKRYDYDHSQYMCCSISMPVEAGAPKASPENPLLGVYISLDTKVMSALAMEIGSATTSSPKQPKGLVAPGIALAHWNDEFSESLLRLLQLTYNSKACAVLGNGRLRELYYAVLTGEAGDSAMRAFGVGNEITRAIDYLTSNIDQTVSIDDMASLVGMSRAVLHRKFKQATMMSPIQFVKSLRLNSAAMKLTEGMNVSRAALEVGYESSSQFSREFKRMFGQSPKQWSQSHLHLTQ
ncbi:AraC family transcriptional regulator [Vibrio sp. UCD-FRSSP16_10]|uniref:AraC family transcriptional regulator n=1 Tax=unclassified Vibrio TaxID=2614977 RepID=UPI0007FC7585|nr:MULTISPECIES: AraC family transcriptional regulator [unclassified Vibrio]OBT08013.1 AraC family transcriptional regulator [Vibrio sp. UCD-FRSSP16_30]OBT17188.1 AraC family transcriptional regulator [Vibrio sp. UCD-FRSSP16_10]